MKLVIDTNVIFSALLKEGKTRDILLNEDVEIYIPEYFFSELMNYEDMIVKRTGIDKDEYRTLIDLLFLNIDVVPKEEFEEELDQAKEIMEEIDPDDSPFLGLAMEKDCFLWSDDGHFDDQDEVKVLGTTEVIKRTL